MMLRGCCWRRRRCGTSSERRLLWVWDRIRTGELENSGNGIKRMRAVWMRMMRGRGGSLASG
uniref:Uncharacterized protein n=1 Tax=Anopheles christyi TaxID=43041 RepID=A0A182KI54_9DIPT